jgi:hypothetical protein
LRSVVAPRQIQTVFIDFLMLMIEGGKCKSSKAALPFSIEAFCHRKKIVGPI